MARQLNYSLGQRVFGRHGATKEYFHGHVVAIEPDHAYPYSVGVGEDEVLRILDREIECDLPPVGSTSEEIIAWLDS
jgi:hypothetical protein